MDTICVSMNFRNISRGPKRISDTVILKFDIWISLKPGVTTAFPMSSKHFLTLIADKMSDLELSINLWVNSLPCIPAQLNWEQGIPVREEILRDDILNRL